MIGNLMRFFSHESCGFCTPCRDGLPWVVAIFDEFCKGQGTRKDLQILHEHVEYMGPGRTFCALAPGATAPLGSGLKYFAEDFEKLIKE
jgi:NADH-quinone oxidoreductase subunit F